ncbi:retrotransposon protein, putative, ty1-copia subclass [Tanacetum coccineum]
MRALLIQHGCEAALEVLPEDMEAQAKTKLNKKAHSAVILCLALTLEDVMATLNLKEIKERSKAKGDDGEGLYVRGRTDRMDSLSQGESELNVSVEEKDSLEQVIWVLYPHGSKLKQLESSKDESKATCTAVNLINRSQSRAIEKKTPIEMWSGHPSDYGMLRIFGCVAYPHDKQGNKSVEELQVEVELQRLNNHTHEEDQTDKEDGDDEDAGDHETNQPPDLIDYQLVRDREPRIRTKPLRFRDKVIWLLTLSCSSRGRRYTKTIRQTRRQVACEDISKWESCYGYEEMDSKVKYKDPRNIRKGLKLVSCKWSFKIKEGVAGVQNPRYKARLVARGFTQRAGIDYKNLEEMIYMRQLPGYEQGNKIYAPGEYINLLLYVDDMLIACKSKAEIRSTKYLLKKEFDIKELEEAKKILSMEIIRDRSRKIPRVSQSGYVSKILNNFRIDNEKSVQMPLGGHFKLSLKDCPVKDCDVERMRYLANPGKKHWEAVKWILKYLRGPSAGMCCKLEGNATTCGGSFNYIGGVYGPYGGCEGSYLAKETLGRRTKHINVRYHFIREVLEAKTVKVLKVGTKHNAADALTKMVVESYTKIVDCKELGKLIIVLVFYHMDPSHVRHQSDCFIEGFAKHESDLEIAPEQVKTWRDAF